MSELDPTPEQIASAKLQAAQFAAQPMQVGEMKLRKPPAGAMQILAEADNKFALGFSKAELAEIGLDKAEIPNGRIVKYMRDVWQWVAVCTADEETLIGWFESPEAFRRHVAEQAMRRPLKMDELIAAFYAVFEILSDIRDSEVETKAPTHKGAAPKKKARNPHTSRNTHSR